MLVGEAVYFFGPVVDLRIGELGVDVDHLGFGLLQLTFQLATRNPFDFRSTIVLLDEGTPIVSAESVNPGWGNLITRGGNIRAIVRRATKRFDKELKRAKATDPTRRCS